MKHIFSALAAVVVMLTFLFGVSGALPAAYAASSAFHAKHLSAVTPSIRVVDCAKSKDAAPVKFLRIYSPANGNTCFRDKGYEGFVRIDNATFLHAGNNKGWVRCYGGPCDAKQANHMLKFNAYDEKVLRNVGDPFEILITQVAITGQVN